MGPVPTTELSPPAPPPTRRRRAVPWAVLGLWLVVLVVAGAFAGKLGDVQRDSVVDYLPSNADSTQVAKVQQALPGGESTDLVVVYHRDGGLTAADRGTAGRQTAELARAYRLTGGPPRRAVQGRHHADVPGLEHPARAGLDGQSDFVDGVRKITVSTGGLTVEVGGPGALDTDAAEVYSALGGPLLYTTVLVVAVLLILIYRSPSLWLLPLFAAGAADVLAMAVTYLLNRAFGITVSGQSSGVMTILVFGVGTDYALLLVARYREELRRTAPPYDAMRTALRGSAPAIIASAGTVAAGMLCLLAADLNSSRGMGPTAAVGVVCALLAMVTLLPAVLVLLGRRVFWPLVPTQGSEPKAAARRLRGDRRLVGRRPVAVLAAGMVLLGALALGILHLPGSVKQQDSFATKPDSIAATQILGAAYPERASQPITVIAPTGAAAARRAARGTEGVLSVDGGQGRRLERVLRHRGQRAPQSAAETATVKRLRAELRGSYVGGPSAQQIDLEQTNARDRKIVVPLALASVLLILVPLLRSLVAPLLLAAAVVGVWGAALGIGGLLFEPVFGFHGTDPGLAAAVLRVPGRARRRLRHLPDAPDARGGAGGAGPMAATLTALRTTGGVIASAGIVLAATFSVLITMPLVQLAELGFVIAVGVLLDTFVVRTFLVTSASVLLKRKVWWPGALSRSPGDPFARRRACRTGRSRPTGRGVPGRGHPAPSPPPLSDHHAGWMPCPRHP